MDTKALALNRYKRMFKLTDDYAWIVKYAQEKGPEPDGKPYKYPSIARFIMSLVDGNRAPFEGNVVQGRFGAVVANVLAEHYAKTLDLDQPAFNDWDLHENAKEALTDPLTEFSKAELAEIKDKVISDLRRSGDKHLHIVGRGLTADKLKDAIDFVLARAYLHAFWLFLYNNPIASILIENKEHPLNNKSAAANDEEYEEDLEEDSSIYEETKQDLMEAEWSDWDSEPGSRDISGLEKDQTRINDFRGQKIKLSHLIKAFKITRALQAVQVERSPGDSIALSNYIATMANIDYLERAAEAIKAYIADNPNNRFLKWHGQPLGANDGDPWVTTSEKNWDTLKLMSPPTFKQNFRKVETQTPEMKEKGEGPIEEYTRYAIRIPFTSWDGVEQEYLGEILPTDVDIYQGYATSQFSDIKRFRADISATLLDDAKTLQEYQTSLHAKKESGDSLLSDARNGAKAYLAMYVLYNPETNGPFEITDAPFIAACNRIWHVVNDAVSSVVSAATDTKQYKRDMGALVLSTAQALRTIDGVQQYIIPAIDNNFIEGGVRKVIEEMNVLIDPVRVPFGFQSMAHTFVKRVTDKTISANLAGFTKRDIGERAEREIRASIQTAVNQRDEEIKNRSENPYEPGVDQLRKFSDYEDIKMTITSEYENKYLDYLKDKKKDSISKLVVNIGTQMFPDAFNSSVGFSRWRAFYAMQKNSYTREQSQTLANVLSTPYFFDQYEFAQQEFVEESRHYSRREHKKRTADEVKQAYEFVEMRINDGTIDYPTEADPAIVAEYMRTEPDSIKAQKLARIETIRRWLLKHRGPEEDAGSVLREMLGEQQHGNTISMGLFAFIGKDIGMLLSEDITQDMWNRFGSPRERGAVGSAELFLTAEDKARIRAKYYDNLRKGSPGAIEPGLDEYADPDQPNNFHGGSSYAYYDELAETQYFEENPRDDLGYDHLDSDNPFVGDVSRDERAHGSQYAATEAFNEVFNYLNTMFDPENLFRVVATRKTRYETVEQARRKPRTALSTHTFGGFIQQMMGGSRSPYLSDFLKSPGKFQRWFTVSCSLSFGNHIGRIVDHQMRKLYNGPDAKYSTIEELMAKVGAFADPMWAFNPYTKAFQGKEKSKRKSGYIADNPDTAHDHFRRAAYWAPSLDPGKAETFLTQYFDDMASKIKRRFEGASPTQIENLLIHRFDLRYGDKRSENWTNNPFKGYTPEDMARLLSQSGVTVEALEQVFGELADIHQKAKEADLSTVRTYGDPEDQVDVMAEDYKLNNELEYANRFVLRGTAESSNAILEEAFELNKDSLSEQEGGLLIEAIDRIKKDITEYIGSDVSKFLMVYRDEGNWRQLVTGFINRLPADFDPVKSLLLEHLDFVQAQTERIPVLEERQQQFRGFEATVETVVEEVQKTPETAEEIVDRYQQRAREVGEEERAQTRVRTAPSDAVQALRAIAQAMKGRFAELKPIMFDDDEFYNYVVQQPQYDENTINTVGQNVMDYILFLESIRPEQVGNQDITLETVRSNIKEINNLHPYALLEMFSDAGLRQRKDKIAEVFQIAGSTQAKMIVNRKIVSLARSVKNTWDDDEYHHFL